MPNKTFVSFGKNPNQPEDVMDTLMTNDEYFGESMVGTREEFRATLIENFREWYRDYDGDMTFEEYVENSLDEHLSMAEEWEIENCERINA